MTSVRFGLLPAKVEEALSAAPKVVVPRTTTVDSKFVEYFKDIHRYQTDPNPLGGMGPAFCTANRMDLLNGLTRKLTTAAQAEMVLRQLRKLPFEVSLGNAQDLAEKRFDLQGIERIKI